MGFAQFDRKDGNCVIAVQLWNNSRFSSAPNGCYNPMLSYISGDVLECAAPNSGIATGQEVYDLVTAVEILW
jgi:hypothetical protein